MATISFEELRSIKQALPEGGVKQIAAKLQMDEDTVRNYFGGDNYEKGTAAGIHIEFSPLGAVVQLDDERILLEAKRMIESGL